ncbi:type I-F CRISPR-associated protein Csy3 [Acidithiobacillus montserratensis]|uniref:Type I-F CRISPR-associated protein Csy3 n=1 Tax=Acidithiobacillus montserratensis TaxID=2729135 RepID=A0ACD5HIL2_9PROT|nr:type I-F CRISPR-associated protein Csy3 [Acidithiobacillus montserratensis]MBU2746594.1 type I-F CRISPR-associated protein Csy3 [Acidithiobacillus montserratensis]
MEININTLPLKNLPSVLAFRRGVIVSDAPLEYGTEHGVFPVPVIRHGTMGTQNVNEKTGEKGDLETVAKGERDVRNLQVIESAKTGQGMIDLRVRFTLKALPLADSMYSCANSKAENKSDAEKMRAMLSDFIKRAESSSGLVEVSRRIARNIVNGRWLWRNRLIANSVEIFVTAGEKEWEIKDALRVPLYHFDEYSETEKEIGDLLAGGFRGNGDKVAINVLAILNLGVTGSTEVFCSQNYEPDNSRSKNSGDLSRSLYKLTIFGHEQQSGVQIVGQAAFRDAKIWNALRTFDTWYSEYGTIQSPIPVEPQGASLSMMDFFRRQKESSAFGLFKRLNQIDPDSQEGMYCIASLIRGGVFGDSEKKRGKEEGGEE